MTLYTILPGSTSLDIPRITHLPVGIQAYNSYLRSAMHHACTGNHKMSHKRHAQACRLGKMQ